MGGIVCYCHNGALLDYSICRCKLAPMMVLDQGRPSGLIAAAGDDRHLPNYQISVAYWFPIKLTPCKFPNRLLL
jgi:hypothetical protein